MISFLGFAGIALCVAGGAMFGRAISRKEGSILAGIALGVAGLCLILGAP